MHGRIFIFGYFLRLTNFSFSSTLGHRPPEWSWTIWEGPYGPFTENTGYQQAGARGCLFCVCDTWRGSFHSCSLMVSFLGLGLGDINDWFNLQEAAEELAPRLEIILQHLMMAFGKYQVICCYISYMKFLFEVAIVRCDASWLPYRFTLFFTSFSFFFSWEILKSLLYAYHYIQRRNLRIVYDAIGTLADAVGFELNQVLLSR